MAHDKDFIIVSTLYNSLLVFYKEKMIHLFKVPCVIKQIIIYKNSLICGRTDNQIDIYDEHFSEAIKSISDGIILGNIAVYEDRIFVVYGCKVHIYDSNWQLLSIITHTLQISYMSIKDKKIITTDFLSVKVWDLNQCLFTCDIGILCDCAIMKQNYLILADNDVLKIYDLRTFESLKTLKGHGAPINTLLSYQDQIVSASSDGTIRIWNLNKLIHILKGHKGGVLCMKFLPDMRLISGCTDGRLRIWDLEKKECVYTSQRLCNAVKQIHILENRRVLIISGKRKISIFY